MNSAHDRSWQCLTDILASRASIKAAWETLLHFHRDLIADADLDTLRTLDVEKEQENFAAWLQHIFAESPVPAEISAFWIGLVKLVDGETVRPAIYIAGSEEYDPNDADWACDPVYTPDDSYIYSDVLMKLDDVLKTDEDNYDLLDWILPLAYVAFTFDEIIRTQPVGSAILKQHTQVFVTVGYDNGDFIAVSDIRRA